MRGVAAERVKERPRRRRDQFDRVGGVDHDQARCLVAGAAPGSVEAQRRSNAVGDRAGHAREGIGVALRERATLRAARDVDCAPDPPADDERRPELVRNARRL